jgi:hypothetical protein
MSIVVRFAPPSPPPATQYDETIRRLEGDGGDFPPDGLEYHIAFLVDGGIRVSEIWDSREKWEAFGERLMPILADVGIEPGEPEVFEVHNTIRR